MVTITIRIKELNNIVNRFPKEFYKTYSHSDIFKNNKIYKVYLKEYNQKILTIYIKKVKIQQIYQKLFIDKYGLQDINLLIGLDNLDFNWNKLFKY